MHDEVTAALLRALRQPHRPVSRARAADRLVQFPGRRGDGEATAGDVPAQRHASAAPTGAAIRRDTA
ncbi:hypothetical protein ABB07_34390 [Streptomyces incarnatus]|uniref:Uncharacterized protein n=1 Tax=Streptomyces incarnatus TaxID=665007 RepID=A0ABN4GMG8_9ACTN|nr:hypothetical protein [Streptomyces incarnatus]AKJ14968.1 hypothetical protein ABB07_34390 [Streptomyces incarnatus]